LEVRRRERRHCWTAWREDRSTYKGYVRKSRSRTS
jgi:hypothetical protein